MNKKGLVNKVVQILYDNNVRKPVRAQKTVMHITDNKDFHGCFTIKKEDTALLYNGKDVEAVIETLIAVVEDALKRGEKVSIFNFGTFTLRYRKERSTLHPETKEPIKVPGRYVPYFDCAKGLKEAAKVYQSNLEDAGIPLGRVPGSKYRDDDFTDFENSEDGDI